MRSALVGIGTLLALGAVLAALPSCRVTTRTNRGSAAKVAIAPPVGAAASSAEPPRAAAPVERVEVDPAAAAALRASGSQPALALVDLTVVPGLTTVALLDTVRTEARGQLAEGGIRQVQLQEGQRAGVPLDLAAGECLTVLAHAGLGVREVDAFVVAGAAPDGEILGQDAVGGPLAIVGGQAGCLRTARAQRVEVVVLARKGRGQVLAAIFRGAPAPQR